MLKLNENAFFVKQEPSVYRHFVSVFPAHAGVILMEFIEEQDAVSVPRVRGGDPRESGFMQCMCWCSPRTRG